METGTTPAEIQQALDRIRLWISRFLPSCLDGDFLATEIWLECWQNKTRISKRLVRFRCIDLMRKELKRQGSDDVEQSQSTDSSTLELRDMLNKLAAHANLSPLSKRLIYHVYYRGQSIADAAFELNIPVTKARRTLEETLTTLRSVYDILYPPCA